MNIATNLSNAARAFPQRTALIHAKKQMNFAQLNAESDKIASSLSRAGILPGEPVALIAPNSCEWIAAFFGILKTGAVAVALPNNITRDELTPILEDCRPKAIFTHDDKLPDIKTPYDIGLMVADQGDLSYSDLLLKGASSFNPVERAPEETGVILYTGGTTGKAKGVMLSHRNITLAAFNIARYERSTETDIALCFLPLNHVFGLVHVMNATIFSAGGLVLQESFNVAGLLDAVSEFNVTRLYAVPTIYCRLLSVPDLRKKLKSVRYCFSAAASMAQEVVLEWKEKTDLDIFEAYGMTETTSMVTYNHYYNHVSGSVGTPINQVEISIMDEFGNPVEAGKKGEICIAGPTVMKGYLNHDRNREQFFWDHWFRSGDIGTMDGDGYIYIVDRIKDIIITGGENVYPKDVEEVLYQCRDIEECAVIGIPDKVYGERVIACIVTRQAKALDAVKLKNYLKERLSPFKIPKDFFQFNNLPKSCSGKLLKRKLKHQMMDQIL